MSKYPINPSRDEWEAALRSQVVQEMAEAVVARAASLGWKLWPDEGEDRVDTALVEAALNICDWHFQSQPQGGRPALTTIERAAVKQLISDRPEKR